MSIVTPVVFTPIHTQEVQNLFSGNEESLRKIIQNLNYLGDLVPIGKVLCFNHRQEGAIVPDGTMWQYCDGSQITNPLSPLRTIGINIRHTPNMTNRYLKSAANSSDNGRGGLQSINFSHGHGVNTGLDSPTGPVQNEPDDDESNFVRRPHSHTTEDQDLSLSWDSPAYFYAGFYLKVT